MATGETAVSTGDETLDQESRTLIHDFRNLLAVIVNYSELIAEETTDPEAVRADILEVRAAAERAIALTDKLPRSSRHTTDTEPPASTS
jgi:two-component system, cell cycle sensor histidine kinase and response regulator CckA